MKPRSAFNHTLLILAAAVLFGAGCSNQKSADLEDPLFQAALDTAVAGAVASQAADFEETLAAASITDTPSPTNTPLPPTPTMALSSTPAQEISVEDLPLVSVSLDTNCRSGPGKAYPYQAGFFVGDEAPVYGLDPSGAWLYIELPDAPDGYCWIWGYYATTTSETDPLPIFTPGPTPDLSPDFTVEFRELEICDGKWTVEFTIENTGPIALESIAVHVINTVNSEQTGRKEMNTFQARGGCDKVNEAAVLNAGEAGFTISQELTEDPTGNELLGTITACTEDNLAVACLTKEIYFTP